MLTIRREQMDIFQLAARADFEERALVHVRKVFGEHVHALGDEAARMLVRSACARAQALDIRREANVLLFVDLLFAAGDKFEAHADWEWARTILGDRSRSETLRLILVYDELPLRAATSTPAGRSPQHAESR
jgi:hypothetical protein